jgi:hypothetical protein
MGPRAVLDTWYKRSTLPLSGTATQIVQPVAYLLYLFYLNAGNASQSNLTSVLGLRFQQ